jgi:hypothetical protein
MDDEAKLPTQPGSPTSEHGQIMFAMGKMFGRLDAIDQKQAYANGRTAKLEDAVAEINKWREKQSGESAGKKAVWDLIKVLAGLIVGALTAYFTLHP